jgi:hypothetical protein
MGYVTVNVDVDVDMYDIDTDDLIEELDRRGKSLPDRFGDETENHDLVRSIYEARRTGKGYDKDLDALIYNVLGRIV